MMYMCSKDEILCTYVGSLHVNCKYLSQHCTSNEPIEINPTCNEVISHGNEVISHGILHGMS